MYNDGMPADLDRWITGNWGQDQYMHDDEMCDQCYHWHSETGVPEGYCDQHCELRDAEDWCDYFEAPDPDDDEPQDFDEWRDENDR